MSRRRSGEGSAVGVPRRVPYCCGKRISTHPPVTSSLRGDNIGGIACHRFALA